MPRYGHSTSVKTVSKPEGDGASVRSYGRGHKPMDQGREAPSGSGMAMEGRSGKAAQGPLMRLYGARNEKPQRGLGLDGLGIESLGLDCVSSVSESYPAVLAESNTPTRCPSTWAKSVGEGLSVWDGLDIAYQSPAGLNTVAIRADLGMTSLPSVFRGVGGSFPGFRAVIITGD